MAGYQTLVAGRPFVSWLLFQWRLQPDQHPDAARLHDPVVVHTQRCLSSSAIRRRSVAEILGRRAMSYGVAGMV
jgi:hypothetical protein